MPRIGSTGAIQIYAAIDPTITRQNVVDGEVSLAQIAASTNLTDFLLRDGLNTPLDGNTFDVAGAAERYNATEAGTFGGQPITASWFRDSTADNDDAWDTLPRGARGVFIVARFGHDGESLDALAADDRVELWPFVVISRNHMAIEQDAPYRFTTSCAVPYPPNDDAVVVTGS